MTISFAASLNCEDWKRPVGEGADACPAVPHFSRAHRDPSNGDRLVHNLSSKSHISTGLGLCANTKSNREGSTNVGNATLRRLIGQGVRGRLDKLHSKRSTEWQLRVRRRRVWAGRCTGGFVSSRGLAKPLERRPGRPIWETASMRVFDISTCT